MKVQTCPVSAVNSPVRVSRRRNTSVLAMGVASSQAAYVNVVVGAQK